MILKQFVFFYFFLICTLHIKAENIIKEKDENNTNFTNNYKNIKVINNGHHEIFQSEKPGYIVNEIYISLDDDTNNKNLTKEVEERNQILKDSVLNTLTFSRNSYVSFKNNTISNNIKRIKRLFRSIEDVLFEVELINDKIDIYLKLKKYKTIKEIRCESGENLDLRQINEEYKDRYINFENVKNIKKIITNKKPKHSYFIIVDNETNTETKYKIEKTNKEIIINQVNFIGNKNIKSNILFNKVNLRGIVNNSIGRNLINEFNSNKINSLNIQNLIQNLQKDVFIWNSIYFDKNKFELDKNEIINLYIKNGYLDAKIDKIEIKHYKNTNVIDINYNIIEGDRYYVGDIEILGNKNISKDVILKILGVCKGNVFNFNYIQNKVLGNPMNPFEDNVKNLYSSLGYLKTNIKINIDSIKNNFVNLKIIIDEDEIVKINKINIVGNRFTNNQFFYRNSYLFPGDTYNSYKFISTQQSIMRNEYVIPNKTLVTLDNDNNIQVLVTEKIIIEPVFNIKAQKVDSDYYCKCCSCCKVAPSITLGVKLGNLNLRKFLHLNDPRYLFLGNGDDLNLNIIYNPVDSRFNVGLDVTIREITKNLGGGLNFLYSSFRGAIDNEDNNFTERKEDKQQKNRIGCRQKVNNILFLTRFIYSSFSRNISVIFTPININFTFGQNKFKVFKCYVDIPMSVEFKYANTAGMFWINDGIDFSSNLIISNPIVFLWRKNIDKRYKIHKEIKFLNTFSLYKSIIKNLVFNFSTSLGFSKAIGDTNTNYFRIKKEDSIKFETTGIKNITYLYLNGIFENGNILRTLNRSNCYLAFKLNMEMRYLFLTSPMINSYVFGFFNAGNLFAGQNMKEYNYLKNINNKQLYNPIRFFSLGIGVRIEPEIIKMIMPISFSIYFDFKNKDLSFNMIKPF